MRLLALLAFLNPQSFNPEIDSLQKEFERGEFQIVIDYFESYSSNSQNEKLLGFVAKSYYRLNNYQKCISILTSLINNSSDKENYLMFYEYNSYLGICHRRLRNLDSAILYQERALINAKKTGLKRKIGIANENLARAYKSNREYSKSINYGKEAEEMYLQDGDTVDAMMIKTEVGFYYYRLGILDSALDISRKSLAYFKSIENREWIYRSSFHLGHIEKGIKNNESIAYFRTSLQCSSNDSEKSLSLSGIGESMMMKGLDSSIYYLEKAYSIAENLESKSELIEINLHRAKSYLIRGEFRKSREAINEGIRNALDRKDLIGFSSYRNIESELFLKSGDFQSSLESINSAVDITKEFNIKNNLKDALTQKFNVLNHFGRYKEAIAVKEEEIKVREELFNDRSEAVYQILRTQNEMDKQESTIANQQLEIDNNNLQITIMYISIALVVSALVFIFWQYRTRSKYAHKLETMFLDSRHRYMNNLLLLKNWFNEGKTENNDEIISFAQNRIDAISTVNRHLDRLSYNKDTIESQSFLEDISHNLLANRQFTSEIQNVPINMSVSGPLGMITNEIITNGLKYGEEPYAIRFLKNGQGYVLEIEDHGPGIMNPEKKGTGSKVLRLLSRQLKGELTYQNKADHSPEGRGTLVSLNFKG